MEENKDVNQLDKLREQRIATFKKAIKDMIAVSKSAYSKTDNKSIRERIRLYSAEEIKRIVEMGDSSLILGF